MRIKIDMEFNTRFLIIFSSINLSFYNLPCKISLIEYTLNKKSISLLKTTHLFLRQMKVTYEFRKHVISFQNRCRQSNIDIFKNAESIVA